MSKFIGLIPLNAENFESGAATAGQVLSADGAGKASWETPSGGGGGSGLAFDGVTFTYVEGSQPDEYYYYKIVLTLGGEPITEDVFVYLFAISNTGSLAEWLNYQISPEGGWTLFGVASLPNDFNWLYAGKYIAGNTENGLIIEHVTSSQQDVFRFNIIMPSGVILEGPDMDFVTPQ